MRSRILVTRQWPAAPIEHLRQSYDVSVADGDDGLGIEQLEAAMGTYDALCPTVCDRLPEKVFTSKHRRVSIIANFGAGIEHIDLSAAGRAGIVVTNTPDVLTRPTAETAVMLMLMAARRAGEGERELRAGRWAGWRPTHLLGTSLAGKTLGLVGFGRIAQQTARMARAAFAMQIAYHARSARDRFEAAGAASFFENLDDLILQSDVLSLHLPGGKDTNRIIDQRRIGLMKPSGILINTARGSLVDNNALAAALAGRQIAAAGLDVYDREPNVDPALLSLENVVLLPHLGSATIETRNAMGMRVADNLRAFFAGEQPVDRVV